MLLNFRSADDDSIQLEVSGIRLNVKVKTGNGISQGLAALSVNLPGMPYIALPASGKFHKL